MFYSILRPPPYDIQVNDDGRGCTTVIVAIARGNDENRVVSVVCELEHTDAICDEPCWEFSFSIDVFALDDSIEPFRTQDRDIAAKYIPADIRGSIMEVVCEALKALLNHTRPPLIYWVTKDIEPPEKAVQRHHLLRETAQTLGYSVVGHGTDPFRRRFWTMRLNAD
jgi:hypothetical protein